VSATLVTWGGDAMPDGVHIAPAEDTTTWLLTRADAEALTAEIRRDLGNAILKLQLAREGHAHTALGYAYWHEYLLDRFGDLKELRLPVTERRALVASMCEAGASVTDIVRTIGFSRGTVQGDRVALGYGKAPTGDVIDLHPEPAADPYEGMSRMRETLARVAAQDDRGLTSLELDAETGWPMGSATANLSKLERRGHVRRLAVFRSRRAAYVVTDTGAAVLAE
jgi:hypothetical protein